jgi:hypothetical protein
MNPGPRGVPSRKKRVALAKKEAARRAKLKALLAEGSSVPADQLDKVYDPASLAVFRIS